MIFKLRLPISEDWQRTVSKMSSATSTVSWGLSCSVTTQARIWLFKAGPFKRLILPKRWRSKRNYLKSLQLSTRHVVAHLEHEERIVRAAGGLTTALANLLKAIFCCGVLGWQ